MQNKPECLAVVDGVAVIGAGSVAMLPSPSLGEPPGRNRND